MRFSYNGDEEEPVLKAIDFVAEPGETVAVLGATGAGKSSLINLIPRFYDVHCGRITIDSVEFHNAVVPDRHGAGIRMEHKSGNLRIVNSGFINNQNGILTANFEDAELHVLNSVFSPTGRVKLAELERKMEAKR